MGISDDKPLDWGSFILGQARIQDAWFTLKTFRCPNLCGRGTAPGTVIWVSEACYIESGVRYVYAIWLLHALGVFKFTILFFFLVQCWNAILSDSCFYSTKKASHIVGKRLNKMKFIQGLNASNRHFPDPFFYLLLICLQRFYYTDVSPKTQPCKKLWLSSHHCGLLGGFWRIRESTPSLTKVSLLWSYVQWVGCCLTHMSREVQHVSVLSGVVTPTAGSEAGDSSNSIRNRMSLREVRRSGSLGFGLYMKLC